MSVHRVDVASVEDTHRSRILQEGFIHASGLLADAGLARITAGSARTTFAPKTLNVTGINQTLPGAFNLRSAVIFSSLAIIGSRGQGTYAAANTTLDVGVADARHAGAPAIAIRWGAWSDVGMAASASGTKLNGAFPLSPTFGIDCLLALVNAPWQSIIVCPIDWRLFLKEGKKADLLFTVIRSIQGIQEQTHISTGNKSTFCRNSLQEKDMAETKVAKTLSVSDAIFGMLEPLIGIENIAIDTPLMESGLDSLAATELSVAIADEFGISVPPTLAFDYPNIEALTKYVESCCTRDESGKSTDEELEPVIRVEHLRVTNDVFVVSLATKHPRLFSSRSPDLVHKAPESKTLMTAGSRWTNSYSSRDYQTAFGVFLQYTEYFDSILFGLGSEEATLMDPQHRLLLLCAKDAFERTGIRKDISRGAFVGVATQDYESLKRELAENIGPYTVTSDALSIATGRLAFVYDMVGPAISIDTACSSSLVAGHFGTIAVREDECGAAAICGVNLLFHGKNTASFLQAGMIAPDGRCKTFDAAADGYVRAEGCDIMVLQNEYCANVVIILGTAVNQDGRSGSLTAPSGPSQTVVITAALKRGNAVGRDLVTIKTHGTGTSLGDPIEIGGALAARGDDHSPPLELHSIKSLNGHAECAAGISGLSSAVRYTSDALVTHVAHLRSINPHVSYSLTNRSACDPKACIPRSCRSNPGAFIGLCGTSAFAFQGTNAHAVVSPSLTRCIVLEKSVQGTSHLDLQRRWVWSIPTHVMCHNPAFQVTSSDLATVDLKFDGHTMQDVQNRGKPLVPFVMLTDVAHSSLQCIIETGSEPPACLANIARSHIVDATMLGMTIRAEVDLSGQCLGTIQIRCMGQARKQKHPCLTAIISKQRLHQSLTRAAHRYSYASGVFGTKWPELHSSSIAKVQVPTESTNITSVSLLSFSSNVLFSSARIFYTSPMNIGKSVTYVETGCTEASCQWTTSHGSISAALHGAVRAPASAFKNPAHAQEQPRTLNEGSRRLDFEQLPDTYLIDWCIIEGSSNSKPQSNDEKSKTIIWKSWSELNANGRAVLRDVYSQAGFDAVPGFEIYIDGIICEAQQSVVKASPDSSTDECSPMVVAAAIELLLAILREAAIDDPAGSVYAFITRGARRRPTVAALAALARGLQLEHPNSYGGVIDYDDESRDQKETQNMASWRPKTLGERQYCVSVDVKGVARAALRGARP